LKYRDNHSKNLQAHRTSNFQVKDPLTCKQEVEVEVEEDKDLKPMSGEVVPLPTKSDPIPYADILTDINATLGRKFKDTEAFRRLVRARIKDGFKHEDFVRVCNNKLRQWGNDPKMSEYLRPETLFGSKMDAYLQDISTFNSDQINDPLKPRFRSL
jgi:uncharacterized phage protein (TIGR02220 family)